MPRFFPSSPWCNISPLDLCSVGIETPVRLPLRLQRILQQAPSSQTRPLHQQHCPLSLQVLGPHGQVLLDRILDLQRPRGQQHGILQPEQPPSLQLLKCLFAPRYQIPQEIHQAQWHLQEHRGLNLHRLTRKVTRRRRSQQEHRGQDPHDKTSNGLLIMTLRQRDSMFHRDRIINITVWGITSHHY